jgi:hypothetical protein
MVLLTDKEKYEEKVLEKTGPLLEIAPHREGCQFKG